MTPSEKARVQECVQELSEILYRNTPSNKCQTLEDIEKAVRGHLLESGDKSIQKKRVEIFQIAQ